MQSLATINQQMAQSQVERRRALNKAVEQLLERVMGCWQHDLSRPFSAKGRTYRVCLKCGMTRNFDPESWKTYGRYQGLN